MANESPYLKTKRLAEVIAAIQVLGTYQYYKLDFAGWQNRIDGVKSDARSQHWQSVFRDHPEFFRIDTTENKASLVLRRSFEKLYKTDERRLISRDEYRQLKPEQRRRVSRRPLTSDEMLALVGTAAQLHDRAIAQQRERRWWIELAVGFVGVVLGAAATLLGSTLAG